MAWIIHIWYLFVICVRFCKAWFVHTWQDAFVYVARYMWNTTSHIWMSRVTHINESCHVSHIWMSHVTRMDASCHMSHIWMRHATHTKLNDHSLTYAKSCVGDAIFVIVRLTRIGMALPIKKKKVTRSMRVWRSVTHWYVWVDVCVCVERLARTCNMTHSYTWHNSFMCVDMSNSYMCHDWRIHTCDMTHPYVRQEVEQGRCPAWCVCDVAFVCVTWRIHTCDMNHSCEWHASFTCVIWLIHT